MTPVRDGTDWEQSKKKTKIRDQYRCQACKANANTNPGIDLQVHHIKPVECGGTNELENLVTLCNSCHTRLHKQNKGEEKLTPDMIDYNRPTFGFPDQRIDLSDMAPADRAIIELLREEGPTQLKDIVDQTGYAYSTISKHLQKLKTAKYVFRVSRGTYAYISKLEYRRAKQIEPNEYGRRPVEPWDPGEQIELTDEDLMENK